jgi:lipoic acid synthetase
VILVEHAPGVITLGRQAKAEHVVASRGLLAARGVEVIPIKRGGDVTYHGPGQLVAYPIIPLDPRRRTVHDYVRNLEEAILRLLRRLGLAGQRRAGLTGVWVSDAKVAAIGVAVHRWVSYHGLALNVAGDLGGFDSIVPCGLHGASVTSLSRLLARDVTVEQAKALLRECLAEALGFALVRDATAEELAEIERTAPARAPDGVTGTGTSDGIAGPGIGISGLPDKSRTIRLPRWLRRSAPTGPHAAAVREMLEQLGLATICSSAHCPNLPECFARRTATFLILGDRCTRSCRFCAVVAGPPLPVRRDEPEAVAEACVRLGLRHVVITSVTRDDLPDGGAGHFARTSQAVRARLGREVVIEILTPDFRGDRQAVAAALAGGCDIFNHNVETVPRLYPIVRSQADYRRSLAVLAAARELARAGRGTGILPVGPTGVSPVEVRQSRAGTALRPMGETPMSPPPDAPRPVHTKSGLMVGLGEARDELRGVMRDLRDVGCEMLTVGQYLAPSAGHYPVARFVEPAEFDDLREEAKAMGFLAVASGPFVRSSYRADRLFEETRTAGRP